MKVFSRFQDLLAATKQHAAAGTAWAVEAGTGLGKSSLLPLSVLEGIDEGTEPGKVAYIVQPRRAVAIRLAKRVAEQRGWKVGGDMVGFRTGGGTCCQPHTRLQFVTQRVLLGMFGRHLPDDCGALIVDEVHERSQLNDLCLLLAKANKGKVSVGIMSAVIDPKLVEYVGDMELLRLAADGQTPFPVDVVFQDTNVSRRTLWHSVLRAISGLAPHEGCLVFLPGQSDINSVYKALGERDDLAVRRLYSALPKDEQDRAFDRCERGQRKVILATDVAETSFTFEDISVVIDCGMTKTKTVRDGASRLATQPITLTSWLQRRGRVGRVQPGKMVCLYRREHKDTFLMPAMPCDDFAWAYLQLRSMGAAPGQLLDCPSGEVVCAAHAECASLALLDSCGLTPRGLAALSLPLDLRSAACLLAALESGEAPEVLPILLLKDAAVVLPLESLDERERVQACRKRFEGKGDVDVAKLIMHKAMTLHAEGQEAALKKAAGALGLNLKHLLEACGAYSKIQKKLKVPLPLPSKDVVSQAALRLLCDFFTVADFRGLDFVSGEIQYKCQRTGGLFCIQSTLLRQQVDAAGPHAPQVLCLGLHANESLWAGREGRGWQAVRGVRKDPVLDLVSREVQCDLHAADPPVAATGRTLCSGRVLTSDEEARAVAWMAVTEQSPPPEARALAGEPVSPPPLVLPALLAEEPYEALVASSWTWDQCEGLRRAVQAFVTGRFRPAYGGDTDLHTIVKAIATLANEMSNRSTKLSVKQLLHEDSERLTWIRLRHAFWEELHANEPAAPPPPPPRETWH